MYNIFAKMRYFLAYVDLERMNIGSIVHQFIRKEIIPQLEKRLNSASSESERDKLSGLITEYMAYSDPRKVESKIYDRTAANHIRQLASRSRMNDEDMEDLAQQLAMDFFKPLSGGNQILMDVIRKLRIEEGPLALNRLWINIIEQRVKYHIRQIQTHYKEKTLEYSEDDEGNELDPLSQVQAPTRIDEKLVEQVVDELPKYMHRNLRTPVMREIFDQWFEIVQAPGVRIVDMRNDIWKPLVNSGATDMSYSNFNNVWANIRNTIVKFFADEVGSEYVPKVRKLLHLSKVEAVTYSCYRNRLAKWFLGGILKARLEQNQ